MKLLKLPLIATGLIFSVSVNAAIVGYVPTTTFGGLDGDSAFNSLFAAGGHTLQAIDLGVTSEVNSVDGLWLHGGAYSLTVAEQTNLTDFLGSGGNAVYITDRSDIGGTYAGSTSSVLAPFGGNGMVTGGDNLIHTTAGSHELSSGVSTLQFNSWSTVDPGLGNPTLLTANGMVAVYGFGLGELLFLGDTNWQNLAFGSDNTGGADNVIFADNVVNWLASSPPAVPVPAAAWLFCSGLLGLIGIARRKKA